MDVMSISDERIRAFLDALDQSDRIEVSDWDASFIESNMDRQTFTEPQRKKVIARMICEYGHKVKW